MPFLIKLGQSLSMDAAYYVEYFFLCVM